MLRVKKKSDIKQQRQVRPAATTHLPPVAQALIRTTKPSEASVSPTNKIDYFDNIYASISELRAVDRLTTLKNFYTKVRYFNRKHTERRKNDNKESRKLSKKRDGSRNTVYEKISTPSRDYLSTTSEFEGEEIRFENRKKFCSFAHSWKLFCRNANKN